MNKYEGFRGYYVRDGFLGYWDGKLIKFSSYEEYKEFVKKEKTAASKRLFVIIKDEE